MIIKDPHHGSQYAIRKHAAAEIEESMTAENMYGALSPDQGGPGFRKRVLQSLMDEFKDKRREIMEEERNRSPEDHREQRDRMKEVLMKLYEGEDPAEALTESDREQFERMADLQAIQQALAEFEVKWSVITN